jgi:hypothetical protein
MRYIMYPITRLQRANAKALGVTIKPSTVKTKKIDVYRDGIKQASIGGRRANGSFYKDYSTYIKDDGIKEANKRRTLYRKRHAKEPKRTPGGVRTGSFYADAILW